MRHTSHSSSLVTACVETYSTLRGLIGSITARVMKNLRTFGEFWRPCFHFSTFVCSLFVLCLFLVSLPRVSGCLQVQNALKAPFKVLFCQPIQGRVLNVKWSPMTSSTLSCTVSWGCQFCGIGWTGSAHFGVWCHMVPPDHIRMIHPYTSQIVCDSDRIMNEVNKWMCMWLYVIVQDEIFTLPSPFYTLLNLREENPKIKDPEPAGVLAALAWPEAQCHRHKKLQNQQTSNISNALELFDSIWVLSAECYCFFENSPCCNEHSLNAPGFWNLYNSHATLFHCTLQHSAVWWGLEIPYLPLDELLATCDYISLHAPLLPSTKHMINFDKLSIMKKGIMTPGKTDTTDTGLVSRIRLKSPEIGWTKMFAYVC